MNYVMLESPLRSSKSKKFYIIIFLTKMFDLLVSLRLRQVKGSEDYLVLTSPYKMKTFLFHQ